jgi:hypothetical protein
LWPQDIAGPLIVKNALETIFTFQGMSGSRRWPEEVLDKALSEEALTAAVMPREHIVREVENELK